MGDALLEQELKELLIRTADKEDAIDWRSLTDDEPLVGPRSRVQMDSIDLLQVSLALQRQYGVRIQGSTDGRRILKDIASLAAYIRQAR